MTSTARAFAEPPNGCFPRSQPKDLKPSTHSLKTNKIAKFSMGVFVGTESLPKPTTALSMEPVALQDSKS
jgi:hypothetical protein